MAQKLRSDIDSDFVRLGMFRSMFVRFQVSRFVTDV